MSYSMYNPAGNTLPIPPINQYEQLSTALRDQDQFRRAVKLSRRVNYLLLFSGILTIAFAASSSSILSGYNRTDWSLIDLLSSAGIFAILFAIVFVVSLVYRIASARSTYADACERFTRGGFVSDLVPTGARIRIGRYFHTLYVIGAPNVPPDWVTASAQHIRTTMMSNPDHHAGRVYTRAITNFTRTNVGIAGVWWAKPANQIDSSIPMGILLYAGYGRSTQVAIPDAKDPTRFTLSSLRKNALQ